MRRIYTCLWVFLLLNFTLIGQATVELTAPQTVELNGQFTLAFDCSNMNNVQVDFQLPSGFRVVGGPSINFQMTNINGKSSSKEIHSYAVVATKLGSFSLGPYPVSFKGRTVKSNAVNIQVVKPSTKALNGAKTDKDVFVTLDVSSKDVYVGQQISFTYTIYFNKQISVNSRPNAADFTDFDVMQINTNPIQKVVTIGGKQYQSQVVEEFVVMPKKSGTFPIIGNSFEVGVVKGQRSIFGFGNYDVENVKADDVTITVKDLPSGAPANFLGVVGHYQFDCQLSDTSKIEAGKAVEALVKITGDGNFNLQSEPKFAPIDGFEIYPPKLLDENNKMVGSLYQRSRQYQVLLVPNQTGNQSFNLSLSYFDIEEKAYKNITCGPYQIYVGGNATKTVQYDNKTNQSQSSSPIMWWLGGALLLVFGSFFIWQKKKDKPQAVATVVDAQAAAEKVAKSHLSKAQLALDIQDKSTFYTALSAALNGYLKDKFGWGDADLEKEKIEAFLRQKAGTEVSTTYVNLIKEVELHLYAGLQTMPMEETYNQAKTIIEKVEQA